MTDIEQKAVALVNEILEEWGKDVRYLALGRLGNSTSEALCRAIEQHEAYKQKVSDAIENEWANLHYSTQRNLSHLIIPKPKPDPLVETLKNMDAVMERLEAFRAALEALEIEIREKGQ
jgi:hypothetical protein